MAQNFPKDGRNKKKNNDSYYKLSENNAVKKEETKSEIYNTTTNNNNNEEEIKEILNLNMDTENHPKEELNDSEYKIYEVNSISNPKKEKNNLTMEYFTNNVYVSIINDHRGHGNSVKKKEDLVYFYEESGKFIVEEIKLEYIICGI